MEANLTAPCSRSNCQIFLSALALAPAPVLPLVHLATVETDPALSHPPVHVHVRLYIEGEVMDTLPCAAHSVADHLVGGVLPVVMSTDQAVHAAALAPDRLFAVVWTDFLQEGGRPVIPVVDMDVCAGQDQEATLCALVVRAQGLFRALALAAVHARAHHLIPRIQDTVGAGVVRGQLAGEEEAIVATISGIAGPGHQKLCNLCFFVFVFTLSSFRPKQRCQQAYH
jgi:hypothetical protein